jgi:hypothetical protein
MLSLFYFFLAILASPFKAKSRLEAGNAALRHQLIVLRRRAQSRVRDEQRPLVSYSAVSMVPVDFAGRRDCSA